MKLPEDIRFPSTLVICEGESKSGSCETCDERQGSYEINSQDDLDNLELPPYHPNCVCEVEICESADCLHNAYGTTREMADLLLIMKKIFENFTSQFKLFAGYNPFDKRNNSLKLLYEWYASRLREEKNPELACRARADLLLQKIKADIPDQDWFEFRHVRVYVPNAGWNLSHSWVELDLQYKDKHGGRHEVRVKYDPYYDKIVFLEPEE